VCIRATYPNPATLRAPDLSAHDLGVMPKRPRRRQAAPAQAANDNKPDTMPVVLFAWDIYRAAARARYVGQVIAADAEEAIEAAAIEFRADIRKLIAVSRWAVA
jgi:hypothetical protein